LDLQGPQISSPSAFPRGVGSVCGAMSSTVASMLAFAAMAVGAAAVAQPPFNLVRREGATSAAALQSSSFSFQLKSILQNECLQLDGEAFSTKKCDTKEPKQQFTAEGIAGPNPGEVASAVTAYNQKQLCWSGGNVKAEDTCGTDMAKFKFEASGDQCFRVKHSLHDLCLGNDLAFTADSCKLDASQWTAQIGTHECKALSNTPSTLEQQDPGDGLVGGSGEGGEGGEAESAKGGESQAIAAGGGVAKSEVDHAKPVATTPTVTTTVLGYRFMMKSVALNECLRLEDQTFQIASCNDKDPQQLFFAHGFLEPGNDVIARNVSMYNGKVLCFIGSDKVEAYDESCVPDFANIELEPNGACFKVKWNKNAQNQQERCLVPPNNDQDMMATEALCTDARAQWTSDSSVTSCA